MFRLCPRCFGQPKHVSIRCFDLFRDERNASHTCTPVETNLFRSPSKEVLSYLLRGSKHAPFYLFRCFDEAQRAFPASRTNRTIQRGRIVQQAFEKAARGSRLVTKCHTTNMKPIIDSLTEVRSATFVVLRFPSPPRSRSAIWSDRSGDRAREVASAGGQSAIHIRIEVGPGLGHGGVSEHAEPGP